MRRIFAIILAAALFTTMLFGCGSKGPASSQSTDAPRQSEPAQAEAPAQTEPPVGEQASPPETPAAADTQASPTAFESDFGYVISYDRDSFDYRRTEGYDEFVLKSDALDKPFVFVCISHIGAEFVDQVKAAALGEHPESCVIGQAQMQGQCSEAEEDWESGKVIRKTYVCPLDSGDALLIETQRYTEQADDPYAARISEMVNSIEIKGK